MTDRLHLLPRHRRILVSLLRKHLPNVEVWAYGSRITGRSHDGSDLDLALRGSDLLEIPIGQLGDFEEAVRESYIPFLVEARDWTRLPQRFHREIERDYVVLVENKSARSEDRWMEHTLSDAVEINPTTRLASDCGKLDTNTVQLGEHVEVVMGQSPAGDTCNRSGAGVPLLNGPTEFGLHHPEPLQFTTNPCKVALPGDLLFCVRGSTTGRMNWADQKYAIGRGVAAIRHKRVRELQPFVRAVVEFNLSGLLAQATGSTFPNVSARQLANLSWPVMEASKQRAIAHILGTLDDKIELNRRMNETLEAMAHALFKSWFVDFDPVRAKIALNHSPLEGESQPAEPPGDSGCGGGTNRRSPQASRWGEIKRSYPEKTLNRAKSLRRNQTDAEGLLWHYLRNKQLDGYKFRRQQPISSYIVDFACLPEKLLIELDGGQHAEHEAYDERRDRFLQNKGYRVLRFWNNEVFENCFDVLEQIYQALTSPDYSPPRSSRGQALEGESAKPQPVPGLTGERQPAGAQVGENALTSNYQVAETDTPPPHQPTPDGSSSATPPQGGSDWTVERARAYLARMDPKIADLFPDRLVDSELGEIPEGWGVGYLSDIASSPRRSINPANSKAGTPSIGLDHMPRYSIALTEWQNSEKVTSNKFAFKEGEFLFGKLKPYFHKVGIAPVNGICSTDIVVIAPIETTWSAYVLATISSFEFVSYTDQMSTGARMPRTSWEIMRSYTLCLPPERLVQELQNASEPMLGQVVTYVKSNRILASLRDTLLPKLISGELRVDDKIAVKVVV